MQCHLSSSTDNILLTSGHQDIASMAETIAYLLKQP